MFEGEEGVSKASAKDCNTGRGGNAGSESVGSYPLQELGTGRSGVREGRADVPKRRYQRVDSTCGDGAGKYAEGEKSGDIGRGGEVR